MELTEDALNHPDGHVNLRALNLIEALDPEPLTENIKNRIRYFADEYEKSGSSCFRLCASGRVFV